MTKRCIICGREFKSPPSAKKVTCSDECRSIRASRASRGKPRKWSEESKEKLAAKGVTPNLKLGTPAAMKSPIAGSFETNQNALIWTIKSPENVVYTVRNLQLWIKNNINLFPGNTVAQVWSGFMQMKRSITGKRKNPVSQYKGWQLLGWEKP